MDKIKILLVASEFAPGMIPYAATIINVLSKDSRMEVHSVVVCSGKKTYRGLLDVENVAYVDYPEKKWSKALYKLFPLKIVKAIQRQRRKFQPDVIHFLTCDFSLGLYNLFSPKRNVYWTIHDLHMHPAHFKLSQYKPYIERMYVRFWNLTMFRFIPNLSTSSFRQYEEMKSLYPKSNCFYVPFPSLVTREIVEGTQMANELTGLDHYILFFGHTGYYKGTDQLVSAYSRSGMKTPLVIAGRGKCEISKGSHVLHINRFIKDEEIADLFKKASLVVYPYRETTMSGVLSIAFYFGKRVLASSTPFFLENEVDGMEYFKAGDEDDLLRKLRLMMDDAHKEKRLDEKAYDKRYSSQRLANEYYMMYKSNLKI